MNGLKFSVRLGSRLDRRKADAYGEELMRLSMNGALTPPDVVEEASDEDSPLHDAFTWDDDTAAREYRLWEARHLLNCIMVQVDDQPSRPVRAFFNITTVSTEGRVQRGYHDVMAVTQNEVAYAQVLEDFKRALRRLKRDYACVKEAKEVFAAIDALIGT